MLFGNHFEGDSRKQQGDSSLKTVWNSGTDGEGRKAQDADQELKRKM